MYDWDEEGQEYEVHINFDAHGIAQKLDYATSEFDEQSWASQYAEVLPVEAQIIAFEPSSTALVTAIVMPRSLNDPVGFKPSYLM